MTKPQVSRKRSLTKAVTWRIIGTTDTTILGWIFTGNPLTGLKIGFAEVLTKTVLYYFHERVWYRVDLKKEHLTESHRRHLAKTVTWRIIGTIDTMILAWVISGNPMIGLKVGATELVTKMALYYLHERAWFKVNFGVNERHSQKRQTTPTGVTE